MFLWINFRYINDFCWIYIYLKFDLEYEYTYIRGELSVDKIMGKERQYGSPTFDLTKLEIVAPVDSYLLDSYKNSNKTYDFTSLGRC